MIFRTLVRKEGLSFPVRAFPLIQGVSNHKASNSSITLSRSDAFRGANLREGMDVRESTITSDNREVFIALASLIRAGRHEMALAILATYSILVFRPFAVHTGSTV